MLGAFLNFDTKTTWVFQILAMKSCFKPHVSNFSFIWSIVLLCTSRTTNPGPEPSRRPRLHNPGIHQRDSLCPPKTRHTTGSRNQVPCPIAATKQRHAATRWPVCIHPAEVKKATPPDTCWPARRMRPPCNGVMAAIRTKRHDCGRPGTKQNTMTGGNQLTFPCPAVHGADQEDPYPEPTPLQATEQAQWGPPGHPVCAPRRMATQP